MAAFLFSSEKLKSKGFPEGAASQPVPDNAHCSQAWQAKALGQSWPSQSCCVTGACCSPGVSVNFTVTFKYQLQFQLVKISSFIICFTSAHSQGMIVIPDLVIFSSTSLQQEPHPISSDSFCHCFPALQTSLPSVPSNFCTFGMFFSAGKPPVAEICMQRMLNVPRKHLEESRFRWLKSVCRGRSLPAVGWTIGARQEAGCVLARSCISEIRPWESVLFI